MTNADDMPVLRMQGICKRYPGVAALTDVRLDVHAGEVHVLMGENGAGKSTLMKILSGATRRDAGDIFVDGRPADIRTPRHARTLGISIIYQELNLIPHLSVAENISLGHAPRTPLGQVLGIVDRRALRARATQLLGELGVDIDPATPVRELGLAQQQMVEIAKALADHARILIMDEPTSALTGVEVEQLFAAVQRLTARGTAIVYISHRMEEVFRIGHRVTVLRDGRYVDTLPIADASIPRLVKLMANRELTDHYPRRAAVRGAEILRVDRLSRRGILHDVSFTLHAGEVLGLAGLVGAGRTELARAIVGADRADGGHVTIKGRPADRRSPRAVIASGLGFLPEDRKQHGLVLGLSVQKNIALPNASRLAWCGVVRGRDERAQASRWIDELRIKTPSGDQHALHLSGGNQQKVVLAKWLAGRADIFIFDEPTRGIDLAARWDIYALMNRLVEQGAGVLMISSELPEVLGMSDRILVMRQGRVCAELHGADRTEARVLQAALGVAS